MDAADAAFFETQQFLAYSLAKSRGGTHLRSHEGSADGQELNFGTGDDKDRELTLDDALTEEDRLTNFD